PLSFSLDETYLANYLVSGAPNNGSTGLAGVSQVLSGECRELSIGGTRSHFYWNPLDIAKADRIEDAQSAVVATERVVRKCVRSWASAFDGVLLHLSGGLDSSIIAACL